METVEHFAKISLVARLLGGERLLSQQEVQRLQGLRGMYGIASPAPICLDDARRTAATCQVVRAPDAPGQRLVPEQKPRRSWVARAGHAVDDGGNSVNIPRTDGPHRRRGTPASLEIDSDAGRG